MTTYFNVKIYISEFASRYFCS